jgi:hypothetical protein
MANKRFFSKLIAAFKPKRLQAKMNDTLVRTTRFYQDDLAQENADYLFYTGKDMEGNSLGAYAQKTIQIKLAKGQPTNRVTLKDEGDFHKSFQLVINEKGFEVIATDYKTNELQARYGKDILGLAKNVWDKKMRKLYILKIRELFRDYHLPVKN